MATLTPQQRVTRSHITIMRSPEFCMFSGVLSVGKVEFTNNLPTAATNGRDVYYNPDFISTLTEKELNFVVLHENVHKAFQHLTLWQALWKENPLLANMAADYVCNGAIMEADPEGKVVSLPASALHDIKYYGMSTKQVYNLLKQDSDAVGGGGGGGGGGGASLDQHNWEEAQGMSQHEVEHVAKQIEQALRQGEIIRSKLAGNKSRALTDLLKPKVDWREQLQEFVKSYCRSKDVSTWRRPNRRFIGQDVYMPSLIGQAIGSLVIAIDTSGSISNEVLSEFLTEVKSICDEVSPEKVELMYWDAEVAGHETYERGQYGGLVTSTKPVGGGGTTVGCVKAFIKANNIQPEAIVIMTDGYVESDWGGQWDQPTLWAITTAGITSPHGKSIYLEG